uniref:Uncharacterized protein n=1 Tax=Triticum aestivum TaxID=4565 RepID=A0A3B6JIH1_WHEAT
MSMELAVIHLARPALTPSPSLRPRGRRMLRLRVRCRIDGDEGGGARGSEEDEPESLFAKELRRRGMAAGSVPSGEKSGAAAEAEEGGPGGEAGRKRGVGAAAAEFERAASGADGQRERSVALNSEGLEDKGLGLSQSSQFEGGKEQNAKNTRNSRRIILMNKVHITRPLKASKV